MPARRQSPLFEGLHGQFVLGMVTGPRGELDVAQLLQLAPHGRFIERHRKLVVKPLDQIDQPPANDAVDRRDRTSLDRLDKRPALGIIEPRPRAGSLAIQQTIGTSGVEPNHPPEPVEGHARSARPPRRSALPQSGCRRRKSRPRPTAGEPGARSSMRAPIASRLLRQNPLASRSLIPWPCPPMQDAIDSDFRPLGNPPS